MKDDINSVARRPLVSDDPFLPHAASHKSSPVANDVREEESKEEYEVFDCEERQSDEDDSNNDEDDRESSPSVHHHHHPQARSSRSGDDVDDYDDGSLRTHKRNNTLTSAAFDAAASNSNNNNARVDCAISNMSSSVESRAADNVSVSSKKKNSGKARHANDILVEFEALSIESQQRMNRPGIRCPTSLPLPITTVGVNCVGRVLHSSPPAALHGVLFGDRVYAVYPFQYTQNQQQQQQQPPLHQQQQHQQQQLNADGIDDFVEKCGYVDAGFAVSVPKHLDAARLTVTLQTYTPLYQSILKGLSLTKENCRRQQQQQVQHDISLVNTNHDNDSEYDNDVKRYDTTSDPLAGKSVVVHDGYSPLGLAYIEIAVGLGCTRIYATASCVHHAALQRRGAVPLGLVPRDGCEAWERWETLRDDVDLVLMHELPSLSMFDWLSRVVAKSGDDGEERTGSMVYYQACGLSAEIVEEEDTVAVASAPGENEENTSPNIEAEEETTNNNDAERDIFDIIEKARAAHEKSVLEQRMETCPHLVIYRGVVSGIMEDPSAWKRDVSFLVGLLSQGIVTPGKYEHVYSQREVENAQYEMGREQCSNSSGNLSHSIVCLPSQKWRSRHVMSADGGTARVVLGKCSETTKSEVYCSTLIAAVWRKYWCQQSYKCTIEAARRVDELVYKQREESIIHIQSLWRFYATKKWYQEIVTKPIILQCMLRRWMACRQLQRLKEDKNLKEAMASTCIAKVCRKFLWKRIYSRNVKDIITCQSLARRLSSVKKLNLLRAQKRDTNARLIQFAFKILTEKLRFNKVLEGMNTKSHVETYAAVVIQTIMRGYLVKRHLTLGRHYASIVQAFTRKSIAQKNYRRTIQNIVTCQSMARSYLAFQTFGLLNYKRNMARGRSNMVNIKRCAMILHAIRCLLKATLIQKAVRGWIVRRQYKKDIKDIHVCQYAILRYLAMKKLISLRRNHYAAISIQKHIRGLIVKRQYMKDIKDITICQYAVMRYMAVKKLHLMRHTAVCVATLQARVRGRIAVRIFTNKQRYVLVLQCFTRTIIARRKSLLKTKQKCSAIVLQSIVRARTAKKEYIAKVKAAILLQRAVRGMLAVKRVARMRHIIIMTRATINLAKIRCCAVILRIFQCHSHAITIQMAARKWLVRLHNKQEEKRKEEILTTRYEDAAIQSGGIKEDEIDLTGLGNVAPLDAETSPFQPHPGNSNCAKEDKKDSTYLGQPHPGNNDSVADVAPSQDETNQTIKSHLRHMTSLATDECILDHMNDVETPKDVPRKGQYFLDHVNAVRDTIGEVVAPFSPSKLVKPPQTPGSCMSDMAESFQTAFSGCIGCLATPTKGKSSRFSYQEYEEGEEQEKSCIVDIDNSIEVIEQFSPSSVVSGMTRSAHEAFNDCDVGSMAIAGAAMSNEIMDLVENRLKALSFASQEKTEPVGFLADTNMAYTTSNVCNMEDGDLAELVFAGTDTDVQPSKSIHPPSNLSNLGDKALAEFVRSVVVIQTYMHESSESRGVNAVLTPMDPFEFENFYKGMLYAVDNTTEAMEKIVACQSAARRLLAKRRVEEIRDACYLVLKYTGTGGTMCTLD